MGAAEVRAVKPAGSWDSRPGALRRSQVLKEVVLERKRQSEALCPQMLEVGEVLAAPTLKNLIQARPLYATKSETEVDPQAVAAGRRKQLRALEEQKATILVPHDFHLVGAKCIRSKWLDDHTASGAEVKSKLVAPEEACGNR